MGSDVFPLNEENASGLQAAKREGVFMRRPFVFPFMMTVAVALGQVFDGVTNMAEAEGGEKECAAQNGDVNADGTVDLSDAVTILGNLFLGNPRRLPPFCSSPTHSGLADTGQSTCHDEVGRVIDCASAICPGQDGFYATGCPWEGRFIDGCDGTVTDTCTGLMWQKTTADTNGDDEITTDDRSSWKEALQYCENLEFAGYDDWRLPNVRELESLVHYGRRDPCMDPLFEVESSHYWTSTTLVRFAGGSQGPETAWFVDFTYGSYVYHGGKGSAYWVRAVRTPRSLARP